MKPGPMEEHERRERIAELARQIWEAEGRPDGQGTRHWLMAERLLEAELQAAAGKESGR
ncbi:hypothetical protein D3C87_416180 [compost metagenome]